MRYIAFLRAINVGGHNVKMDHLRALFEDLGFSNVETFIASGNVLFDSPSADAVALEQRIEQHLKQALGYEVATFLRTPAELAAVVAHQPFPASDPAAGHALTVTFLKAAPGEEARQKLLSLRNEIDDFHVHQREAYWLCATRTSDSKFIGFERALRMPATSRNVTTVRKLGAKCAPVQEDS
jgi:uncharacterized protein (DUF1697 family)